MQTAFLAFAAMSGLFILGYLVFQAENLPPTSGLDTGIESKDGMEESQASDGEIQPDPKAILDAQLDLSNQGLKKVPEYVFSRTNSELLNLSHNNLEGALQAEVRHLSELRVLDLSYNRFTGVPAEIGQLHKLEILDLSHNQLTGLPYELGNLQNLKVLNVSGNEYAAEDLERIRAKLPDSTTIITK